MKRIGAAWLVAISLVAAPLIVRGQSLTSRSAAQAPLAPGSARYQELQQRLAVGWNTWDVHSVTTQVLLPEGLAIHVGLKHNTTLWQDAFLGDALIGRLSPEAEQVFPGPHSWEGSYTDLRLSWKGHELRLQTAHDGSNLVMLATPLPSRPLSPLPATIVFSVNYLWDRPGSVTKEASRIEARGPGHSVGVYCTCENKAPEDVNLPVSGPYFSTDFVQPVGISTGVPLAIERIQAIVARAREAYQQSVAKDGKTADVVDAIQTVLGWDTIYEPEGRRVISPVSRVWSVTWGGYVIFDWDTFFAATMASVGDRDLAYADAIETLRSETQQGFVPNYARSGDWKSSDRSEPPVGSITVLGLYQRFHDLWLLQEAFAPLLRWNRWWAENRDIEGYLTWGSDGKNVPENLDDTARGTRAGAILESGLDNSPMYDDAVYDAATHKLEFADVGLMSLYIADCDALATVADTLGEAAAAKEIRERGARYRGKLATLWNGEAGIFLNKDLHTGQFSTRLSPTNFYPLLAKAATPQQADAMIKNHLMNPKEFWGEWIIPSIARDDRAFKDQEYWRGRIWGPMNYLVYLGLRNYDDAEVSRQFAQKSYELFLQEWKKNGHVHENYNGVTGVGDDVRSSDRFYHWGALLGYIQYLQETQSFSATCEACTFQKKRTSGAEALVNPSPYSPTKVVPDTKLRSRGTFIQGASGAAPLGYQGNLRVFLLFCNRMLLLVRQAVMADVPALENLIRASVLGLQASDYTLEQREQALELVFGVDTQLIEDGTYFVAEAKVGQDQVIAGCGGWSKRKTLFGSDHCAGREDALLDPQHDAAKIRAFFVHPDWARRGVGSKILEVCEAAAVTSGFRRLEMGATLTGVPLYSARGYVEAGHREVSLRPGVSLPIVHMVKQL